MDIRANALALTFTLSVMLPFARGEPTSSPEENAATGSQDTRSAAYWIGQLNADAFAQRERAVRQLVELGQPAIAPLLAEIANDQPEVRWRGVVVLGRIADADDDTAAFAAEEALVRLTEASDAFLARLASEALGKCRQNRQPRALRRIEELGGELRVSRGQDEQVTVAIGPAWTGKAESLRYLGSISTLRGLDLEGSAATDQWLARLARCRTLVWIGLNDTQVTDRGLEHLSSLRSLRRVYLSGTQVSDEGVERLQKRLPRATIIR